MSSPVYRLASKLPSAITESIKTQYTRQLYHRIDDEFIKYHNRLNNYYHTIECCGEKVTFHCPTIESWKMIHRRLESELPVLMDIYDTFSSNDFQYFYDIGANVGTYSCVIGKTAKETIAFEPYPQNNELLIENTRLNAVDVSVFEYALSDTNSTLSLLVPVTTEAGSEQGTILETHPSGHSEITRTEVAAARLDDFIDVHELPLPDVIKIDVEGAGLQVLAGMGEQLAEAKPRIYIEPHFNSEELVAHLQSFGYRTRRIPTYRADQEHLPIVGT